MSASRSVPLRTISEAIAKAIGTSSLFKQAQARTRLTEGIPETPLAQVYFESQDTSANSNTDRRSFGSTAQPPIKQSTVVYHIDIYAAQRNNIGADMAAIEDTVDEVDRILDSETRSPFFGVDGIKSFKYRIERVVFDYASVKYAGARFIITMTVV